MDRPPGADQYLRILEEGRGNQRRLGIWVGEVPVESPDALSRTILGVENGPLLLFNGKESLLQKNKLLEMNLRRAEKELEDLKAKHTLSNISAQTPPQAQQESSISTTTAPIRSNASNSPFPTSMDPLVKPEPSLRPTVPSSSTLSLSIPSSTTSKETEPEAPVQLRKEHSQTQPRHHEAPSQPSVQITQDEPAPKPKHEMGPLPNTTSTEAFRFIIPESPYTDTSQEVFGRPRSQASPHSQDKPQSIGVPAGRFTFHLPMRPSPLREVVAVAKETEVTETIQNDAVGIDSHRHDTTREAETAPSDAPDTKLACDHALQEDESSDSLAQPEDLPAFPDPTNFSGNPSTFQVFDAQVLLKFALDGANFPTRADRYTYLMSRLEGDALELIQATARTWAEDRESLNAGDDEEPWMMVMTILSAAYGHPSSPAQELHNDSEERATCDDPLGDDADCPSITDGTIPGLSNAAEAQPVNTEHISKSDEELRPKPEVFTSKPYILTEEEAWAAAEKMAKAQAGHDHS